MLCYNLRQIKRYQSSMNFTSCSKKNFLQEIILIVRDVTVLEQLVTSISILLDLACYQYIALNGKTT